VLAGKFRSVARRADVPALIALPPRVAAVTLLVVVVAFLLIAIIVRVCPCSFQVFALAPAGVAVEGNPEAQAGSVHLLAPGALLFDLLFCAKPIRSQTRLFYLFAGLELMLPA